jgi:hypothetical protein
MGYVEIIYKDHSGLRIENGDVKEMAWDYCGVCREIKASDTAGSFELGTFICHSCLGTPNGQSA